MLYNWIILENDRENKDFEIVKDCSEIAKLLNIWYEDGMNKLFIASDNKVAFNTEFLIGKKKNENMKRIQVIDLGAFNCPKIWMMSSWELFDAIEYIVEIWKGKCSLNQLRFTIYFVFLSFSFDELNPAQSLARRKCEHR